MSEIEKFDYCISNPPYQDDTVADNQAPPIYNLFFNSAMIMSENVSYIFKDNWAKAVNDTKNKLQQWRGSIFKTHRISSIDFVGSPFPTASVTTSIVMANNLKNNHFLLNGEKIDYPTEYDAPLFSLFERNILNKIKIFTTESVGSKVINFRKFSTSRQSMRDAKKENKGIISVLSFVGNSREWTKASPEVVKSEYHQLLNNKFKLGFADIRPWQQNEKEWFYDLGENAIPGEGFSCIVFNNKEERENYKKYIKTALWRYLCKISKVNEEDRNGNLNYIPNIDYTNNNSNINWDEPLDEQLYNLFNLTEDEIKTIEENA